jgi:hypothetical protein
MTKNPAHLCDLPLVAKNGPKFCALGFGQTESDAKYFPVGLAKMCEFLDESARHGHFAAKVLSHAKVIVNESNRKI